MSEKRYPEVYERVATHTFNYLFPGMPVSSVIEQFWNTEFDESYFEDLTWIYGTELPDDVKSKIKTRLATNDGKTYGEILEALPSHLHEYFEPNVEYRSENFQTTDVADLGSTILPIFHGPALASSALDWSILNDSSSSLTIDQQKYGRDLLMAASLFANISDIVLGTPTSIADTQISEKIRARITRELLYVAFHSHEYEAHLIASTIYTGEDCDPFNEETNSLMHIHEQFLALGALEHVVTASKAHFFGQLYALQGDAVTAERYEKLASTTARLALPVLLYLEPEYKAIHYTLQEPYVVSLINEYRK